MRILGFIITVVFVMMTISLIAFDEANHDYLRMIIDAIAAYFGLFEMWKEMDLFLKDKRTL